MSYANLLNEYKKNLIEVKGKINVSFEMFPPKSKEMEKKFWLSFKKLKTLNPKFISITDSANCSQHKCIINFMNKIKLNKKLTIVPHLTCINSDPQEIKKIAINYWNNGIRNLIALRGDFQQKVKPSMYGVDLVFLLKKVGNFYIYVAAYPELHPESKNIESDILNLKRKVEAGANSAITQFFFNVEKYLKFRERCIASNINIEIIPGILPIINFSQLNKFLMLTNVKLPNWMYIMFDKFKNSQSSTKIISALITIDMIRILIKEGVRHIHFYTLNHADLTFDICKILGISSFI